MRPFLAINFKIKIIRNQNKIIKKRKRIINEKIINSINNEMQIVNWQLLIINKTETNRINDIIFSKIKQIIDKLSLIKIISIKSKFYPKSI